MDAAPARKTVTKGGIRKVVLAYSGGLDTSIILKWLTQAYGCEVVTFTADLGQDEDLSGVEAKAHGHRSLQGLRGGPARGVRQGLHLSRLPCRGPVRGPLPPGHLHRRPLIAKRMVEIARAEGAQAVAHGATGKGNDQVRFELTAMALAPRLKTIALARVGHESRTDLVNFAKKNGIPVPVTKKKPGAWTPTCST